MKAYPHLHPHPLKHKNRKEPRNVLKRTQPLKEDDLGRTMSRKKGTSEKNGALPAKTNRTTKRKKKWAERSPKKKPEKQHSKEKGMLKMKSHCYRMRHRQVAYVFVKQVVFLTVNHRGPLPLRELHSTDETIVWRDPGGS